MGVRVTRQSQRGGGVGVTPTQPILCIGKMLYLWYHHCVIVSRIYDMRDNLYENVNITNLYYDLVDLYIYSCSQIRKKNHEIAKKYIYLRICEKMGWIMTYWPTSLGRAIKYQEIKRRYRGFRFCQRCHHQLRFFIYCHRTTQFPNLPMVANIMAQNA